MANLLDPPVPSLRDEVASVLAIGDWPEVEDCTDAVLAVVRRHVEAAYGRGDTAPNLDGLTPQGCFSKGVGWVVLLLASEDVSMTDTVSR